MNLETNRLIIRRFQKKDKEDLLEYLGNINVVKYEPYEAFTVDTIDKELNNRINNLSFLAVELKEEKKVIGNLYISNYCGYEVEIGYVFSEKYWNMGYAFESCSYLIKYLFNNNVRRVIAMCNPENHNSWKLLERLGFIQEGCMRKNIYFKKDKMGKPIYQDTLFYSYMNDDKETIKDDELLDFLIIAKKSTYAANMKESKSSRNCSHDLRFKRGEYEYHDSYIGGLDFIGEEIVWKDNEPFWGMNYYGNTLNDKFDGDFLKEALSNVSKKDPFRGPKVYIKDKYKYITNYNGNYRAFNGTEKIFYENILVYKCRYHGGLLK